MDIEEEPSLLKIARLARASKNLVRTGWMLRGIPPAYGETVAAHSYEAALIALHAGYELKRMGVEVDPYRAAALALIHDIAEGLVGDIVKRVTEAIGAKEKEELELAAVRDHLGENSIFANLLSEFAEQKTTEAVLAKFAEQLSTLMQALTYRSQGFDVNEIACSMAKSLRKMAEKHSFIARYVEHAGIPLRDVDHLCKKASN
ncbi:MAG: HD family hydrolase [Thermoproteota archaeon]